MDMTADEAVRECLYGMHEDVPQDRLDNVLHELGIVGFDALPLLCVADILISDGIAAKLIDFHFRFYIAELPPGGQNDEDYTAAISELDTLFVYGKPLADGGLYSIEIYSPGGMVDGSFAQDFDVDYAPSRRRNPIIADVFSHMNYMERRGSGFEKINDDYCGAVIYRPKLEPKFYLDASSFWTRLCNLNYNVPINKINVGIRKQLSENRKAVV